MMIRAKYHASVIDLEAKKNSVLYGLVGPRGRCWLKRRRIG